MPSKTQRQVIEQVDHINKIHIDRINKIIDQVAPFDNLGPVALSSIAAIVAGRSLGLLAAIAGPFGKEHQDVLKATTLFKDNIDSWLKDLHDVQGVTVHQGSHGDWIINIQPASPGDTVFSRQITGVGDYWPDATHEKDLPNPSADGQHGNLAPHADVKDLPQVDSTGKPIPHIDVKDLPQVDSTGKPIPHIDVKDLPQAAPPHSSVHTGTGQHAFDPAHDTSAAYAEAGISHQAYDPAHDLPGAHASPGAAHQVYDPAHELPGAQAGADSATHAQTTEIAHAQAYNPSHSEHA